MKLVTLTEYLAPRFGIEKTIEIIADAGFDGIDYSAFDMHNNSDPLNQSDYRDYARRAKNTAEALGLRFYQAHAPFASSKDDETYNREIKKKIIRAMEAASIMGAEVIVVHPMQHLNYVDNKEKLFDMNMEFYNSLIPYCKDFGIRIACENMFTRDKKRGVIADSVCADPREFAMYIDSLNSPWITACVDIGHCGLCGREPSQVLHIMGSRTEALHIHDNDYRNDCHTLPCTMSLDWNSICRALAETNYKGNFTYEADMFLSGYDDSFLPCALKFMHDTGRYLIKKIQEYKNEL